MIAPLTKSHRRALWMLQRLREAEVQVRAGKAEDGTWGLSFPNGKQHTAAQQEVAVDAILLGIAYPRAFGTLIRLLRNSGEVQ